MVKLVTLIMLVLPLLACQPKDLDTSKVLVQVNGSEITGAQLTAALTQASHGSELIQDKKFRQTMLESLVLSRALSQQVTQSLTASDELALQLALAAHKEKLLAKYFVQQQQTDIQLSEQQITAYYLANPQQFGATVKRKFEMLKAPKHSNPDKNTASIELLNSAIAEQQWAKLSVTKAYQQAQIVHREGLLTPGLFHPRLEQNIRQLNQGETSKLILIRGEAYAVRLIQVEISGLQPLVSVKAKIKQQLLAQQTKRVFELAKVDILAKADIQYHN